MSTNKRSDKYNMRYLGDQVLMRDRKIASGSIKEIIREIDMIEEEEKYIKEKFMDQANLASQKRKSKMNCDRNKNSKLVPLATRVVQILALNF